MSLPPDEAERLTLLRTSRALPQLRVRIQALRGAGWSYQAIASALLTYRSTVRSWAVHPDVDPIAPEDIPSPPGKPFPQLAIDPARFSSPLMPLLGIASLPARLSQDSTQLLGLLSDDARRVRGHTPADARSRLASHQFDALLLNHRTRGVTVQELAAASRLTSRAIRTRLPAALPARPELINVRHRTGPLLLLWDTHSGSRKWRTFVLRGTRSPMAFSPELIEFPGTLPYHYHVLSPNEAERQLGWPKTECEYFPEPV